MGTPKILWIRRGKLRLNEDKKTPSYFNVENKRVIVGFGDVRGFGEWSHRSSTSPEEFKKFIISAHNIYIDLRRKGYFVKLLADGLMFVRELPDSQHASMFCRGSLYDAWHLTNQINELIRDMPHPRPNGYRVRLVKGDVLKLTTSPNDMTIRDVDYIGYTVNLAFRLLNVEKQIPCICHESLREQINGHEVNLKEFKLIEITKKLDPVDGIDEEDLKDLWEYQCLNKYLIDLSNSSKRKGFISQSDLDKQVIKKRKNKKRIL